MKLLGRALPVLLGLIIAGASLAQPLAPAITVTKVIDAPVADVWKAWTTVEKRFAKR